MHVYHYATHFVISGNFALPPFKDLIYVSDNLTEPTPILKLVESIELCDPLIQKFKLLKREHIVYLIMFSTSPHTCEFDPFPKASV